MSLVTMKRSTALRLGASSLKCAADDLKRAAASIEAGQIREGLEKIAADYHEAATVIIERLPALAVREYGNAILRRCDAADKLKGIKREPVQTASDCSGLFTDGERSAMYWAIARSAESVVLDHKNCMGCEDAKERTERLRKVALAMGVPNSVLASVG